MAPRAEIDMSKIPAAIEMLDAGKSKKEVCAFIGMAYNTTRLSQIIEKFLSDCEVDKEQRRKRRGKPVSQQELANFCEAYLIDDDSIEAISNRFFRSQAIVKSALDKAGALLKDSTATPLSPSILPEPSVREEFAVGEKVWSAQYNCLAEVVKVVKEDTYRLYLLDPSMHRYVHAMNYDIGSLQHLKSIGVNIDRLGNVMGVEEIHSLLREALTAARKQENKR